MNKIHQTIKTFLQEYGLDNPDTVYLTAFSGGFDSMCLLSGLKKISKNRIIALHLNHKWRGEESDNEELNCKNFCETIGVEFYCENISPDTPKTETAAREARYDFFERCAKKFNSNVVFTAHNKNDNAETLIYRIATGTGISGLQGICAKRGIFYRPLLEISRSEIETYCREKHLNPNIDSSNSDTKCKRNFIRANIIPALLQINPDAIEKINSLAAVAKEETQIIENYITATLEKISDENRIITKKFLKLSSPLQKRIIYRLFTDNNLEYDRKTIIKIHEFIKENSIAKSGKTCSLTDNLWIFTNQDFIEIIDNSRPALPYFHITKEGRYENNGYTFELEKFAKPVKKFPKDSENTAYVDLSRIPVNFELRPRQEGDIIQPLGIKGTQKLKKYLNAKKIPNHKKDSLLFLAQNNEILWAIGSGISDKIKVTTNPTHRIKLIPPQNS